jgi:hypothetical protein
MDGTGDRNIKQNKSGLERKRSIVFFHIWKIDSKDNCICKNKYDHTHTQKCLQ